MSADAELRARLELSLHLHNLTQAEKTLLARDLLQFATPEDWLRVANECLLHFQAALRLSHVKGETIAPVPVEQMAWSATDAAKKAVRYLDESKAREAGGT